MFVKFDAFDPSQDKEGIRWRVSNGTRVNVWKDSWIANSNGFRPVRILLPPLNIKYKFNDNSAH